MEPITPTVVALKLAPSAIRVVGGQLAGRLSPDEEKRLQKALAEVLVEAAGTPRPKVLKHPFEARAWRKDRKRVQKALKKRADPGEMSATVANRREGQSSMENAQQSWREILGSEFAVAAEQGLTVQGEEGRSWMTLVGTTPPQEWGKRVQQGLEWRMAADKDLRYLLQRLDWGTEQAWRQAEAYATSVYLDAVQIAVGLGFAILLALIAIAVILAVT